MLVRLDPAKIKESWNPFENPIWDIDPITENEIHQAKPIPLTFLPIPNEDAHRYHTGRIAWFVLHGIPDPIEIDFGCPALGCDPLWPITDGNHRFMAAIIRNDPFIMANAAGDEEEIERYSYEGHL